MPRRTFAFEIVCDDHRSKLLAVPTSKLKALPWASRMGPPAKGRQPDTKCHQMPGVDLSHSHSHSHSHSLEVDLTMTIELDTSFMLMLLSRCCCGRQLVNTPPIEERWCTARLMAYNKEVRPAAAMTTYNYQRRMGEDGRG